MLEFRPGGGNEHTLAAHALPHATSIEIDSRLAAALGARLDGTNVTVIEGDASVPPFADASCSGAIRFTMLDLVSYAGRTRCSAKRRAC